MTPPDPHLLTIGYPKCGNVWLRSLLGSLLPAAGLPFRQVMERHPLALVLETMDLGIKDQARQDQIRFEPLRVYQEIPLVFTWAIADFPAYVASTSMAHTHSMWQPQTAAFLGQFSQRILIVRDPRDVAVSWSRWCFSPFNRLHRPSLHETPDALLADDLLTRVKEWTMHTHALLLERPLETSLHLVFYEQLVADTPGELRRIADHLSLSIDDEALRAIAAQHEIKTLKQSQPYHVFRGGWGNWLDILSDAQAHSAQRIAGRMMKALGYPLNQADAQGWSPEQLHAPERP